MTAAAEPLRIPRAWWISPAEKLPQEGCEVVLRRGGVERRATFYRDPAGGTWGWKDGPRTVAVPVSPDDRWLLDHAGHRAAFPVPPVSHRVEVGRVRPSTPAPVVRLRGATGITTARLDAMRGHGRLNTKQVQALWLKAGVPCGVGGALTVLTHYLGKGWVTRPVKGSRNVPALWEVVS